jgi:uncharacterized coiled-coil protein SlyX
VKLPTVSDLIHFGSEQVEALATLPDTIVQLNRTLTSFAQTVARLDKLVRRLDRLTEPLEAPLAALTPRLEALVPLLDHDLISSLPGVMEAVQRNAIPALEAMAQTQAQVAAIASSVDRLMTVMDDGFARLQDLPGAALVSRLRGSSSGAKGAGAGGASAGGATGAGGASGAGGAGSAGGAGRQAPAAQPGPAGRAHRPRLAGRAAPAG